MLRWFLKRRLNSEEKQLGESVDYLRHVVDVSPALLLRFASILPFANSRRVLPKEAWYAAQLVALRQEDCGPCLQIGVNLARRDGVDAGLLRAVLDCDLDQLSQPLREVVEFTRRVVENEDDPESLRQSLRTHYGDRGLIELAYSIAGSRIPPTVKRVLGYGKSCRLVTITTDGESEPT